jgi:exodeoxyribonuclease VII small subunit
MSNTDGHEPAQDHNRDIDSLSFEEAFRRLGEMATSLEDGALTLAQATARYEEGMNLVRRCNKLLDEAELKITDLKDSYTGSHTSQGLAEEV